MQCSSSKNLQLTGSISLSANIICMVKVISRSFACEYHLMNSTLWYELAHVHLFSLHVNLVIIVLNHTWVYYIPSHWVRPFILCKACCWLHIQRFEVSYSAREWHSRPHHTRPDSKGMYFVHYSTVLPWQVLIMCAHSFIKEIRNRQLHTACT